MEVIHEDVRHEFNKLSLKREPKKFAEPPSSLTLKELIEKLHEVFSEDEVSVEYVMDLLTSYKSVRSEWKKYAKFDPHRYTRNLVDKGNDKFNLMILCWNEGSGSSIHAHANAHCFVKVLEGKVREELYDWPNESGSETKIEPELGAAMVPREVVEHEKEAVTYIHDNNGLLHRVENPSNTDRAVTLHIYSPPFQSCYTFDQKTGKKRTAQMTFYSYKGRRTPFIPASQAKLQEQAEDN